MYRIVSLLAVFAAGTAMAQTPPARGTAQSQPPSSFYPAPPPDQAPQVQQGAPTTDLTSPLAANQSKATRTEINSDTEAQLLSGANKIVWGRYAKIKGAKPGDVVTAKNNGLWTIKGKLDSVAPGTEGDWVAIDGVVERISAGHVQIRGEVAFRVAKVQQGVPCKVGGTLNFRRSGKSNVWRLVEGDNPCDGTQEMFDIVFEKPPGEKKPVPAQRPPKAAPPKQP
jgi:hypothetical protein